MSDREESDILTEAQVRRAAGRTYFSLQDEGSYFLFDTRNNGDVGDEEAGQEDIDAGVALTNLLRKALPAYKVDFEIVDEWVHVSVSKEPKRAFQA
jgi:hypothetical protein